MPHLLYCAIFKLFVPFVTLKIVCDKLFWNMYFVLHQFTQIYFWQLRRTRVWTHSCGCWIFLFR